MRPAAPLVKPHAGELPWSRQAHVQAGRHARPAARLDPVGPLEPAAKHGLVRFQDGGELQAALPRVVPLLAGHRWADRPVVQRAQHWEPRHLDARACLPGLEAGAADRLADLPERPEDQPPERRERLVRLGEQLAVQDSADSRSQAVEPAAQMAKESRLVPAKRLQRSALESIAAGILAAAAAGNRRVVAGPAHNLDLRK